MKLPITGQRLIDLIPQKPPFVLISSLLQVSDTRSVTKFTFNESHVLCNSGKLTVAGMMENIAQTAAAKMGYECNLLGKNQIFDVSIITGSIKLNGEEIAHCKMKIFVEPEDKTAKAV